MKHLFIIIATMLVAIILQAMPLPLWMMWFRPEWLLLVLLYWTMYSPEYVGLNTVFAVGIVLDLFMGTLLGENAGAFVLIAYLMLRFSRRIRLFPLWQQTLILFVLMLIFQTYKFIIWRWLYGSGIEPLYWVSAATTALLWPWVYAGLNKCRWRRDSYYEY